MFHDDPLLHALKSDGAEREQATAQLRAVLFRGLSAALTDRYGSPFSVEDVVQDAVLKILHSLDKFDGRCKFTTWAMTVATRIGISSLRRKHHRDASLEAFQGDDAYRIEVAAANDPGGSTSHERQELLALLQQLIDTELTDRQRMALRAFLAGYSTDGIAERVGGSRNAVYKLVHDARQKLKDGFVRAGVAAEDVQAAFA